MSDDTGNVVRLVSDNRFPRLPSCTHCAHYHPNDHFDKKVVTWHLDWPFRRVQKIAGTMSHLNAVCSYFGGHHASDARQCCEGNAWEARDDDEQV